MSVVLDTNVLLDLWVFEDPRTLGLRAALEQAASPGQGQVEGEPVQWLATAAMREEFRQVLAYPHLLKRMQAKGLTAEALLARFDAGATLCPEAPKAPFTCKDPDDQKFIDLGVQHQALLLSKDKAVLCMKKRLEGLGCRVRAVFALDGVPTLAASAEAAVGGGR
jgi:predicted nucleic acid-binding protein